MRRVNNLIIIIPQVTIELRFRKSLAQERFKSNLEFRYQIIVASIKFRIGIFVVIILLLLPLCVSVLCWVLVVWYGLNVISSLAIIWMSWLLYFNCVCVSVCVYFLPWREFVCSLLHFLVILTFLLIISKSSRCLEVELSRFSKRKLVWRIKQAKETSHTLESSAWESETNISSCYI